MEKEPVHGVKTRRRLQFTLADYASLGLPYARTKQGYTLYLNRSLSAIPEETVVRELMYLVWAGLITEKELRRYYFKGRLGNVLRKHYSALFEAGYVNWLKRNK